MSDNMYIKAKQLEEIGKTGMMAGCSCFGIMLFGGILIVGILMLFGILAS